MKWKFYPIILVACTFLLLLAGCGGGVGSPTNKQLESQSCIDCHRGNPISISPVTGKDVVEEFEISSHYKKSKVSCNDCHEKSVHHPESCVNCHGGAPTAVLHSNPMNPSQSSRATSDHPELLAHTPKCFKCHFLPAGYASKDVMTYKIRMNHMSTSKTSDIAGRFTNYLPVDSAATTMYADSCSRCHNPHDNSSSMVQAREWAASGKGVAGATWGRQEWRLNNITPATYVPNTVAAKDQSNAIDQCVRCHTTTGYLNLIGQGTSQLPAGSIMPFGGPALSQGRESLFCNACHVDYSYARRTTGPVTVYHNLTLTTPVALTLSGSAMKTEFKDIGTSNLCLWCHNGRGTVKAISLLASNPTVSFDNLALIVSHYLTAGASLLQSVGYEFTHLDANRSYSLTGHQNVGMTDIYGGAARGPCITCHMKPSRHTFEPLSTSKSNSNLWLNSVNGRTSVCSDCHIAVGATNINNKTDINNKKEAHKAALTAVYANLTSYHLRPAQVYNIRSINKTTGGAFVKYSTAGSINTTGVLQKLPANLRNIKGSDLMGATFNYVALTNDFGSYVHNVPYAKKLMYDTIDLLDNGVLDYSTCNRLTAMSAAVAYSYLCANGTSGNISERP